MQRVLPFSLAALTFVIVLGLALSFSFAPTLAQDDATPTPDGGEAADTGADTGADTAAQPDGPIFLGGADASPAVQTVLTYFQTFDPNLLAENIQFRDYSQAQGLTTREDVTGAANLLNAAFSGQTYNVQRVLTADNTVVVEFEFSGTHSGDFMGAQPTQQLVNVPMVAIIELAPAADMGDAAEADAAEGEAAEGEAAEGDAAGDMTAQAGMQIVRLDLYYDASQLGQQLGLSFQAPGADTGADTDAGADTGAETGEDTGADAGADAADDAGAETDAGADTDAETSEDTGEDTGEDAADDAGAENPGMVTEPVSVMVQDQAIADDGTVLIDQVTIPVNGWVDIHADDSGTPGAIIGFAQVAAGDTANVPVPVDGNQVTGTLWAMLHIDLGEAGVHEFPGPDVPVMDANGNMIVMPFAVSAPGEGS